MTKTANYLGVHVRWAQRRDLPEMLAIEHASHARPWEEADFLRELREPRQIGMVAEHAGRVVGFMVYRIALYHIEAIDFAVLPEFRRKGVGRAMIAKLMDKITESPRTRLVFRVRERELSGQLFLRACGFRAKSVMRGYFGDEDAYVFVARATPSMAAV